ncbi:MAG: hypothetical protein AUI36_39335 [Cyanobacteria bacterium 13_1_40CM_2_61_4]|nr:MAG: hypothetical protein AUI36_39335 [Cyanobacteria bacterium 13_1_40CM_2_61_4]
MYRILLGCFGLVYLTASAWAALTPLQYTQSTLERARAIFDAAARFENYRLPELFVGLERTAGSFPVQYLGANIPQAWAAGAVFHLLQTILGIRPDAPAGTLYVNPTLPDWLPEIELANLKVGRAKLHLRFWREGINSRFAIVDKRGDIAVRHG